MICIIWTKYNISLIGLSGGSGALIFLFEKIILNEKKRNQFPLILRQRHLKSKCQKKGTGFPWYCGNVTWNQNVRKSGTSSSWCCCNVIRNWNIRKRRTAPLDILEKSPEFEILKKAAIKLVHTLDEKNYPWLWQYRKTSCYKHHINNAFGGWQIRLIWNFLIVWTTMYIPKLSFQAKIKRMNKVKKCLKFVRYGI